MNEDNKYDAFKEIFSRKLENHQTPVDPSVWKEINRSLNSKSFTAKKIIVTWGSIAASIAILLAMAILYYDKGFNQSSGNHKLEKKPYETLEYPNDEPALVLDSTKYETNHNHQVAYSSVQLRGTKQEASRKTDYVEQSPRNDDYNIEKKRETDTTPFREPKKMITPKEKQEKQFAAQQTNEQDYLPLNGKKQEGFLLSVSFHTINTTQSPYYGANVSGTKIFSSGEKIVSLNKALIPNNVDGEYLTPLSFGLTLRKNINTHWGIETGLVYTYLSSIYKWNDSTPFDATQQLHYLGIPVNGVVYLLNNNHSQWNVYISAGAMLEKGLWMNVVRNQYLQDRVVTTAQKSYIDGWQWSLNSSAGISYRFADKMKLYLEPRLSYYFDNGQPVSIRTDRSVSVGFGAGLQYSF